MLIQLQNPPWYKFIFHSPDGASIVGSVIKYDVSIDIPRGGKGIHDLWPYVLPRGVKPCEKESNKGIYDERGAYIEKNPITYKAHLDKIEFGDWILKQVGNWFPHTTSGKKYDVRELGVCIESLDLKCKTRSIEFKFYDTSGNQVVLNVHLNPIDRPDTVKNRSLPQLKKHIRAFIAAVNTQLDQLELVTVGTAREYGFSIAQKSRGIFAQHKSTLFSAKPIMIASEERADDEAESPAFVP